jgi:putative aminopeptidase FrvX
VIHSDDYDAAKELLIKLVEGLDRTTLQTIIENS